MNDKKSQIISSLIDTWITYIPYPLVSWGYMAFSDGGVKEFWIILGVLLTVRLFFSIIDTLGSILSWRLHGKRAQIERYLTTLRENNFPTREEVRDDFLHYVKRIQDDSNSTASIKGIANDLCTELVVWERSPSFLHGMRMYDAADEALDIYSPRTKPLIN